MPLGLLAARFGGKAARFLAVFGRTPLFTYLCHIFLLHTTAVVIGVVQGVPASAFYNWLADPSRLTAARWGLPLGAVYVIWVLAVATLYPLATA